MADHEDIIIKILEDYSIQYWRSGKNVSVGAVGIRCPFCNDHSNHLGIFKSKMTYSCWRCKASGHFSEVVAKITGLDIKTCRAITEASAVDHKRSIKDQIQEIRARSTPEKETFEAAVAQIPKYCKLITPELKSGLLSSYLRRRKMTRATVIQYGCYLCGAGLYCNRMIIPIYHEGKLVSFQAADLTEDPNLPYKNAPGDIRHFIYRLENAGDRLLLTEGILDSWRIGEDAAATFTKNLTDEQIRLIIRKNPKELVFCWDADAWANARRAARLFRGHIDAIYVIKFPYGEDPDSYGREETLKLVKKEISP